MQSVRKINETAHTPQERAYQRLGPSVLQLPQGLHLLTLLLCNALQHVPLASPRKRHQRHQEIGCERKVHARHRETVRIAGVARNDADQLAASGARNDRVLVNAAECRTPTIPSAYRESNGPPLLPLCTAASV